MVELRNAVQRIACEVLIERRVQLSILLVAVARFLIGNPRVLCLQLIGHFLASLTIVLVLVVSGSWWHVRLDMSGDRRLSRCIRVLPASALGRRRSRLPDILRVLEVALRLRVEQMCAISGGRVRQDLATIILVLIGAIAGVGMLEHLLQLRADLHILLLEHLPELLGRHAAGNEVAHR